MAIVHAVVLDPSSKHLYFALSTSDPSPVSQSLPFALVPLSGQIAASTEFVPLSLAFLPLLALDTPEREYGIDAGHDTVEQCFDGLRLSVGPAAPHTTIVPFNLEDKGTCY